MHGTANARLTKFTIFTYGAMTQIVQTRAMAGSFYDLSAKDIDGNDVSFDKFKGKVVLVTNVASK